MCLSLARRWLCQREAKSGLLTDHKKTSVPTLSTSAGTEVSAHFRVSTPSRYHPDCRLALPSRGARGDLSAARNLTCGQAPGLLAHPSPQPCSRGARDGFLRPAAHEGVRAGSISPRLSLCPGSLSDAPAYSSHSTRVPFDIRFLVAVEESTISSPPVSRGRTLPLSRFTSPDSSPPLARSGCERTAKQRLLPAFDAGARYKYGHTPSRCGILVPTRA